MMMAMWLGRVENERLMESESKTIIVIDMNVQYDEN